MMNSLLHINNNRAKTGRIFDRMVVPAPIAVLLIISTAGAAVFAAVLSAQTELDMPHGAIQISCWDCHTDAGFKPIRSNPDFNHGTTRFPLQGMHTKLDCRECHLSLVFSNVGASCSNCHADIHRRQFGSNCERCHDARGWQAVKRSLKDHTNRFPLVGRHAAVECEACHKNAAVGLFRGLSTDCASCHMTDFLGASSINHRAAQFPTTCQTCHGMDSWMRGFNHDTVTAFALTGAHRNTACQACHVNGQYTALGTTCVSCHRTQYANTVNPNHGAARFSQECVSCHTTTVWAPAAFNHGQTNYPLTAAHAAVPCGSCHISGRFAGTPTDCFSCHAEAYAGATDPNHVAAGFSRDCGACHTNATWAGAAYNHVSFPIYTGKHKGKWTACSNCHINTSSYGVFSCITCHQHEQSTMDKKHIGVSGYLYSSTSCYYCHPTGQKS